MLQRLTDIPSSFFTKGNKRLSLAAHMFLVLLCVAFFAPGIVSLPTNDRDEALFAQASKQMIESGNYTDIKVQDKARYKKPIGIYWLQAASVQLFNPDHLNEIWAYRIPSFIGATTAVIMTARLGALLFGPLIGFLAAIMLAGCVILNVEARLATTDAALLGAIIVALYAIARVYKERKSSLGVFFMFWTALAVGFLLKGPVILLVLFSTLLWLRWSDKNLKWLKELKLLPGLAYALLLTAPWFIAIGLQSQGAFFQQSAGQDMLSKIWQGQDRGIIPPSAHLLAFPVVFFPFALFALLAVPDSWKNRRDTGVKFLLGWIIPTWIVFELSLTKLPHYVMITYPAIAILAAKAFVDGYPALAQRKWRWVTAVSVGVWLVIGTGFAFVFGLLPYLIAATWNVGAIAVGALLILAQGAALFFLLQRKANSIIVTAAGSLIFLAYTFGILLPSLPNFWITRDVVLTAEYLKPCDELQIISAAYKEPSLVFMAGTNTKFDNDGEAVAKAMKQNPCAMGLIDKDRLKDFLAAYPKKSDRPMSIGNIHGYNMGNGKIYDLTLFRPRPKVDKP